MVDEVADGHTAQHRCQELQPDILLLDLSMPGPPAVETIAMVHTNSQATRIIILSAHNDSATIHRMIAAGIAGYVLKDEAQHVLIQAIAQVMQGQTWFSQEVMDSRTHLQPRRVMPDGATILTKREREVLQLIAKGKTDREVGHILGIAERTVRYYLRQICDKLQVNTRIEAAVKATQMHLFE